MTGLRALLFILQKIFLLLGNFYKKISSADKTIKLWDWKEKKMIESIGGHESIIWSISFSENGKYLATGDESGMIAIHTLQ